MATRKQIHDFNPGIASNGVFWTTAVDPKNVRVNLEEARASLDVTDLPIEDYGDVVNALTDGPSLEASVSFHARWNGVIKRVNLRNVKETFVGEYIHDHATLRWSGSNESGFSFVSDPGNALFAEIGHERNGVFFS